MMEKTATSNSHGIVQIRQKIKEVFGWDCTMKDDVLVKRYSMTSNGGIDYDIEVTSFH